MAKLYEEVIRLMKQLQIASDQGPVCKATIIYDDGKDLKPFVKIPKGNSKSTFIKLRNIFVLIIEYCTNKDGESLVWGCLVWPSASISILV